MPNGDTDRRIVEYGLLEDVRMARKPHPLPQVTDPVYEIIIKGTATDGGAGTSKAQNVFYYRLTTPTAPVNKTNLAAAFRTAVIVPLLAAANIRYAPNRVSIRNIQNVADQSQDTAQAGVGAIATDSLPSDDSIVCILTSSTRGKMCQGRKHFGMGSEIDTTNDILTVGAARWTAVRDGIKLVLTDADANVWTPFVLSRNCLNASLQAPVKIFGANVTGARLLLNIGTMRRRRTKTVYA